MVLNAFALRSTDPKLLRSVEDPNGPANDEVIRQTLATFNLACPVIVGWGADSTVRQRSFEVLALIAAEGYDVACLGVTSAGYPRHPLYLRRDAERISYRGLVA